MSDSSTSDLPKTSLPYYPLWLDQFDDDVVPQAGFLNGEVAGP